MVLAEHNNRLPPVADKRRVLWRRGQRKFALQAIIFFGHRKSRECSPKIRDFRASGIPVGERGEKLPRSLCILLILFFILTVYNGFGDNQNGINSMRRKLQISVRRLLHA